MLLPNLMKLGSLVLVVSKLTDARSNAASWQSFWKLLAFLLVLLLFFSWGETESTWYCDHCLAYCTSPRW
jgi:hypothetical protein